MRALLMSRESSARTYSACMEHARTAPATGPPRPNRHLHCPSSPRCNPVLSLLTSPSCDTPYCLVSPGPVRSSVASLPAAHSRPIDRSGATSLPLTGPSAREPTFAERDRNTQKVFASVLKLLAAVAGYCYSESTQGHSSSRTPSPLSRPASASLPSRRLLRPDREFCPQLLIRS